MELNKIFYNNLKVLKKILIFLPLVLFILFPYALLLVAGEYATPDDAITKSLTTKGVLYGPAYTDNNEYYKLQASLEKKPFVLVLGTSRVMQFNQYFFNVNVPFYNAGGGIKRIQDFKKLLEIIPIADQPEIIIVGLDQYFFNEKFDKVTEGRKEYFVSNLLRYTPLENHIFQNAKLIWIDIFNGKFNFNKISHFLDDKYIGLNAKINGAGFQNDGSYLYGNELDVDTINDTEFRFSDSLSRIDMGNARFQYSNEINPNALNELDDLLRYCHSRNITVIGFLPPYAPKIVDTMKSKDDKYQYLFALNQSINPIFKKYFYSFYDFTDIRFLGSSDIEYLDGFHGSEKSYLRIMIYMNEHDPVLGIYSHDNDQLINSLNSSKHRFRIFIS